MGGFPAEKSIGQRFGKLLVCESFRRSDGLKVVRAKCDCGGEWVGPVGNLRSGSTRSCGCLASEATSTRSRRHGMCGTPEYVSWAAMLQRCRDHTNSMYGGKGIKVCDRWNSFENFYADMGPRPSQAHSIDRIDNKGDYCPENCRWATDAEQSVNRSSNNICTYKGRSLPLKLWCDELGLNYATTNARLRMGWCVEDAFETPTRGLRRGKLYTIGTESLTVAEWSRKTGIWDVTLQKRLRRGMTIEEAIAAPTRVLKRG